MLNDLLLSLLGISGDILHINNGQFEINKIYLSLTNNEIKQIEKILFLSSLFLKLNQQINYQKNNKELIFQWERQKRNFELYKNGFFLGINDILEVENND